jgi:hypothetical protein
MNLFIPIIKGLLIHPIALIALIFKGTGLMGMPLRIWFHMHICKKIALDKNKLFKWAGLPFTDETISAWECNICKLTGWVDKDKKTHWTN